MDKRPFVTVGIPAYNAERFISFAIKSVLNQSFTDFELIITDDGSSDRTDEIIRSFSDSRIRYLRDCENWGIARRLNQQIDLARGKYFCRMDSDDIMLPNRLEKQVKYMNEHPSADILGGGAYIIDDENRIIGKRGVHTDTSIDLQEWRTSGGIMHPTAFGKIEIFRRLKYSHQLCGVEDLDLWFRVSQSATLVNLHDVLMYYREPPKMKIATFLFRQRQYRRFWCQRTLKETFGAGTVAQSLLLSHIKSIVARCACLTGLDSKLMNRRNTAVDYHSPDTIRAVAYINQLTNQ